MSQFLKCHSRQTLFVKSMTLYMHLKSSRYSSFNSFILIASVNIHTGIWAQTKAYLREVFGLRERGCLFVISCMIIVSLLIGPVGCLGVAMFLPLTCKTVERRLGRVHTCLIAKQYSVRDASQKDPSVQPTIARQRNLIPSLYPQL